MSQRSSLRTASVSLAVHWLKSQHLFEVMPSCCRPVFSAPLSAATTLMIERLACHSTGGSPSSQHTKAVLHVGADSTPFFVRLIQSKLLWSFQFWSEWRRETCTFEHVRLPVCARFALSLCNCVCLSKWRHYGPSWPTAGSIWLARKELIHNRSGLNYHLLSHLGFCSLLPNCQKWLSLLSMFPLPFSCSFKKSFLLLNHTKTV